MTKVMIVTGTTSGGVGRHVSDVARGCYRRGLGVHVVCASRRGPGSARTLAELREAGIAVDEIEMRRGFHPVSDAIAALQLRRLIQQRAPDLLHLHSAKAGALGRVAALWLGPRRPAILYTPHAYAFLTQAGRLRRLAYWCIERMLARLADCIVAVSQSEACAALSLGARARIVIPNGVEAGAVGPAQRATRADCLRIGWLGRMTWQKHPLAAVHISTALSHLGIDHRLIMAGDGPELAPLRNFVRGARAGSRVRLLGHVADVDAFYAGIDVLLITSRGEGLPYAGLDAMARGIPLIAFDVAGVRDLVEHGATGMLAPAGDVHALALLVSQLARETEMRARFAAAARARVRNGFDLADQLERLCALYQSHAAHRAAARTGH